MTSLSVPVLSAVLWSGWETGGGGGSKREKGRWGQHPLFFLGNLVCANERCAAAALPSGVVGAGGVFII